MVAGSQENQCYSPTLGEMACELSISRSTVFEHIAELRKKGLLCGSPNRARSLTLSSAALELLSCFSERGLSANPYKADGIPLAGRVAAGAPLEAIENVEHLSLTGCFGSGDDLFALEVTGQSMIDEDIREGDYVICRRSRVAENGQLVVAIVNEQDATLKRFYREADRARLQPANEDYEPIYSDNCRIEAIVIGLVRKL
jgi:repressor LexA